MKLYKILSFITLMLLAMSCSNDELLSESNIPNKGDNGEGAYITVKLGEEQTSRASTETTIKTLALVLLDKNNKMEGCRYLGEGQFSIDGDGVVTCGADALTFLTQETEGLKVVVFANVAEDKFTGKSDINGLTFTLDPAAEDWKNDLMLGSTLIESISCETNGKKNPYLATIELEKQTARVDLASFTEPKFLAPGSSVAVPATSVAVENFQLENGSINAVFDVATLSFTNRGGIPVKKFLADNTVYNYDGSPAKGIENIYVYSFPINETPKVVVDYAVFGKKTGTARNYFSSKSCLEAGYVYQMKVSGEKIETFDDIEGDILIEDCDGKQFKIRKGHQVNWRNRDGAYQTDLIDPKDIYEDGKYRSSWKRVSDMLEGNKGISASTYVQFINESSAKGERGKDRLANFTWETTVGEWLNHPDLILKNKNIVICPAYIEFCTKTAGHWSDHKFESISRDCNTGGGYSITVNNNDYVRICNIGDNDYLTENGGYAANAILIYDKEKTSGEFKITYDAKGYTINRDKKINISELLNYRYTGKAIRIQLTE